MPEGVWHEAAGSGCRPAGCPQPQWEPLTSGQGEAALQHHLHLAQHQRILPARDEDGDVAT